MNTAKNPPLFVAFEFVALLVPFRLNRSILATLGLTQVGGSARTTAGQSQAGLLCGRKETDGDTPATASPTRSGPRVAVDREEHNFGKADVGVTGRHPFVFTNTGNEPLVLSQGRSTCGCCTCVCAAQLPQGAISPGRSAKVTLEWKSKLYVGPFRQTATILTNDPDRREVTLLIVGRFAGPVGVVPLQLSFNSLRTGHAATADVRLYTYLFKSNWDHPATSPTRRSA